MNRTAVTKDCLINGNLEFIEILLLNRLLPSTDVKLLTLNLFEVDLNWAMIRIQCVVKTIDLSATLGIHYKLRNVLCEKLSRCY